MQADAQLLAAAAGGDPDAMQALLAQLRPDIRRYAAYQCGRATALDDVVQEALIIVHRRIGTVRDLKAFAGWLARVITRLCLLPPLQLLRAVELLSLPDRVDFSSRRRDDLRADVVRALESLPEGYREVVVMRDFEELTIGEMAERLSLTREATKSRLHRARALVREYLVAGGHEP
jgi:RNA polymerase sigma factor (sigma-70 family)